MSLPQFECPGGPRVCPPVCPPASAQAHDPCCRPHQRRRRPGHECRHPGRGAHRSLPRRRDDRRAAWLHRTIAGTSCSGVRAMSAASSTAAARCCGTSHSAAFMEEAGQSAAIERLHARDITGLIVIGGNGSQAGAYALCRRGVAAVGVASTIDNDLAGSDIWRGWPASQAAPRRSSSRRPTRRPGRSPSGSRKRTHAARATPSWWWPRAP